MSQCQFIPFTKLTGMGLNLGFHGERPVSKCLNHGRAPVLKMRICNHYKDWSNVQNFITDKLKSV